MRKAIPLLLALSVLLAAAGITVASVIHGPPEDVLATVVPEESVLYVSVFLDPSTRQGRSARAFFGALELPDLDDALNRLLRPCEIFDASKVQGVTQVAMFVLPSGAVGCAMDADGPPEDVDRSAYVRGNWVLGDAEAIAASVRTSASSSLAADADLDRHAALVGHDRIALVYSDRSAAAAHYEALDDLGGVLDLLPTPGTVAFKSEEGRLVLDGSATGGLSAPVDLSKVPGGSLLASSLTGPDLNDAEGVSRSLEAESWLDDGSRPVVYLDPRDTDPWLGLVVSTVAFRAPVERLDRAILGVNEVGDRTSWRLVIAVTEFTR